jgi:methylmalonyl-CoA mutase
MNAAIDQQCEYYIKENSLEKEVEVKNPFIKQKE